MLLNILGDTYRRIAVGVNNSPIYEVSIPFNRNGKATLPSVVERFIYIGMYRYSYSRKLTIETIT